MKITGMVVTPIAIADPPLRNAPGIHEPYVNRIIVEMIGEDGVSGWSESAFSSALLRDLTSLAGKIVGTDSMDHAALYRWVTSELADGEIRPDPILTNFHTPNPRPGLAISRTFSALEVAASDLTARSLNVPLCDLLGGKVRSAVSFSAYLFYKHANGGGEGDDQRHDEYGEAMSPGQVVAQAQQMIRTHGFRSVKLKAGVLDPDLEIESIRELRRALGPDVPLRIDPNAAWTVETAVRVGQELADELEYFEDPTAGIPGMGEVRRRLLDLGIDLPQATNMCVVQFDQIAEAVALDAVQIILGDHHYWGGLRATQDVGRICQTFGMGMSMHSNSHLGISLMAMTHVASVTPNLTYDVDTHYPWIDASDEIIEGGKLAFVDGALEVPDGPGLGITINRDALARQHELFNRIPYRDRDDVGHMQRTVDPTWSGSLPRW